MAKKELGGGSILDQSHIMDMILYLFSVFEEVFAINSNVSSLEISSDDIAEMIVKLKDKTIVSIHTDIFGRSHKKTLEIKAEKGNIALDIYDDSVKVYRSISKSTEVFKNLTKDFNLNYINEMKNFIESCKNKEEVRASLDEGIEVMNLILSAKLSSSTKKTEKIIV